IYVGCFICYILLWLIIIIALLFNGSTTYFIFSLGWVLVFCYFVRFFYCFESLQGHRVVLLVLFWITLSLLTSPDTNLVNSSSMSTFAQSQPSKFIIKKETKEVGVIS